MTDKISQLRFHKLAHLAESPRAYRYWLTHERKDSAAMRVGRAVHSMVLHGQPPIVYEGVRRGRDWEAFRAGHPDHELLSPAEEYTAREIYGAVSDHPAARALLTAAAANIEREIAWVERGRPCGGRIDMLNHDGILVSLKTCKSPSPRPFAAQAAALHYIEQEQWYRRGLSAIGERVEGVAIVAAQASPPWDVVCYAVTYRDLDSADREIERWLDLLERCEASDEWPGQAPGVVEYAPPSWAGSADEWEVEE